MRMPYIGGRGPDYTTKLNLMYNLSDECRVGGVAAGDLWAGRERGGEGRRRPRRGRGTTLTQVTVVGRKRHGQVETREAGEGLGRALRCSQKGHRHPCQMDGESSGHIDINTRNNPRTPESAKPPRKVATPLKRKGRLLEARGNRSPPRSESL